MAEPEAAEGEVDLAVYQQNYFWVPHKVHVFIPAKIHALANAKAWKCISIFGEEFVNNGTLVQLARLDKVSDMSLGPTVANLVRLSEFGEGAVLHQLRRRFLENRIYTNIGTMLVSVNPYKLLPIYGLALSKAYQEDHHNEALGPHVFQVAAEAYARLTERRKDQAIIISGESGAGKTEATKLALQYLSDAAGSKDGVEQLILQSGPVLEAFGNAKTERNNNSSRFGKWMTVDFDSGGRIVSCHLLRYLLEKSRVITLGPEERNYHAFYHMFAGTTEEEKLALGLKEMKTYRYLNQSGVYEVDAINDEQELEHVTRAMRALSFPNGGDLKEVWRVLAAVLHIGQIDFVPTEGGEACGISDDVALEWAARTVGVTPAVLCKSITTRSLTVMGKTQTLPLNPTAAREARDSLAKDLYSRLFEWVLSKINDALRRTFTNRTDAVGILDIFGFEIMETNSFEQLCINYANEKLQQQFTNFIFKLEQAEYAKEGVDVSEINFRDNVACLALLDHKRTGILSLLDETSAMPQCTDEQFVTKVCKQHGKKGSCHDNFAVVRRNKMAFVVKHFAGDVTYEADDFLDKNKDKLDDAVAGIMRTSELELVADMYAPEEDEAEVLAKSSGKRGKKQRTLAAKFRKQLASLYATLGACTPHYIRCVKPNDLKEPDIFQAQMVLQQMRYSGVIESIRIRKQGFPYRESLQPWCNTYSVFLSASERTRLDGLTAGKARTGYLLEVLQERVPKLDRTQVRIGRSKIFMKDEQRFVLSKARQKVVAKKIVILQAFTRGQQARERVRLIAALDAEIKVALAERRLEPLTRTLDRAQYELSVQLFVIHEAKHVKDYLIEEERVLKLLRKAAASHSLDQVEGALDQLESSLDTKWPSSDPLNHRAPALLEVLKEVKRCETELLAQRAARGVLAKAVLFEDIERLEAALAEAKRVNLTAKETKQATECVVRLKREQEITAELIRAVANGTRERLTVAIEDFKAITMTTERMQTLQHAEDALKKGFEGEIAQATEEQDTDTLETVLFPQTTSGTLFAVLRPAVERGLQSVYVAQAQAAVAADDEVLLRKTLPAHLSALQTLGVDEAVITVIARAVDDAVFQVLVAHIRAAEEARDKVKLQDDLVPLFAAQHKPKLADLAREALANLYHLDITELAEQGDAEALDELLPKLRTLQDWGEGFQTALLQANERHLELLKAQADAMGSRGERQQLELEFIPHLKKMGQRVKVVTTHATHVLTSLYDADVKAAISGGKEEGLLALIKDCRRLRFVLLEQHAVSGLLGIHKAKIAAAIAADAEAEIFEKLLPALSDLPVSEVAKNVLRDQANAFKVQLEARKADRVYREAQERKRAQLEEVARKAQEEADRIEREQAEAKRNEEQKLAEAERQRAEREREVEEERVLQQLQREELQTIKAEQLAERERINQMHAELLAIKAKQKKDVEKRAEEEQTRQQQREAQERAEEESRASKEEERRAKEEGESVEKARDRRDAEALQTPLQQAVDDDDMSDIINLLELYAATKQVPTALVLAAQRLQKAHEEKEDLANALRAAIKDADVDQTTALLERANELSLDEPHLLKRGRALAFGMDQREQLLVRIKAAAARLNLDVLKALVQQADDVALEWSEPLEQARITLQQATAMVASKVTKATGRTLDVSKLPKALAHAYTKFIEMKGQYPFNRSRLLRLEQDFVKHLVGRKKDQHARMRLSFQKEPLCNSLNLLTSTYCGGDRLLSKHIKQVAKDVFTNICSFQGDLFHPYPAAVCDEVIRVGIGEPLLRDEIFSQLIKQTTLNRGQASLRRGLQMMYMCLTVFSPSRNLLLYLMGHLAGFAYPRLPVQRIGFVTSADLATNCWIALQLAELKNRGMECGPRPSLHDIKMIYGDRIPPMYSIKALAKAMKASAKPMAVIGTPVEALTANNFVKNKLRMHALQDMTIKDLHVAGRLEKLAVAHKKSSSLGGRGHLGNLG